MFVFLEKVATVFNWHSPLFISVQVLGKIWPESQPTPSILQSIWQNGKQSGFLQIGSGCFAFYLFGFSFFSFGLFFYSVLPRPGFVLVFGAAIIPAPWDPSAVWWLVIVFTGTPGRELSRSHIQVFGTSVPRHSWTKCKLAKKDDCFFLIVVQISFLKAFIFYGHALSFPAPALSFQFQRSGLAHHHSG